ncbi:MAG: hypothetical protein JKY65_32115 [Planctomycetes bacterium]|nr:hypothetical protein [Planctomycetota bacterium]
MSSIELRCAACERRLRAPSSASEHAERCGGCDTVVAPAKRQTPPASRTVPKLVIWIAAGCTALVLYVAVAAALLRGLGIAIDGISTRSAVLTCLTIGLALWLDPKILTRPPAAGASQRPTGRKRTSPAERIAARARERRA